MYEEMLEAGGKSVRLLGHVPVQKPHTNPAEAGLRLLSNVLETG
ncbi:hypothetical protein [Jiella marina]|nr:hypothetical protein [Jiella sp. LLJ827]